MSLTRLLFPSPSSLPPYANTVGRAVHIKLFPRPANIAESRQILSVLQRYGEVVTYLHLKHDPALRAKNTVLALYKDKAEADRLLNASPLSFEIRRDGVHELQERKHKARHSSDVEDRGKQDLREEAKQSSRTREFELRIEPSGLNYQAYIQRQHYYGSFEPNDNNIMFSDLERRVPNVGMADCRYEKGSVELRLRKKRMAREQRENRGLWRESLEDMWRKGRRDAVAREDSKDSIPGAAERVSRGPEGG